MKTAKSSKAGIGCALLFLAPFALVGLFMTGLNYWSLYQWIKMRQWKPVEVTLLEVRLDESRGEDDTSYQIQAKYEYVADGRRHVSERVALHGGHDNIGDFQHELGAALQDRMRRQEPWTGYYDPARPSDAVLHRDIRLEMLAFYTLFAWVFGTVGCGGLSVMIFGLDKEEDDNMAARKRNPDEPWKWRPDWEQGHAKVKDVGFGPALWMAAWCNFTALPCYVLLPYGFGGGRVSGYLSLIFVAIGLFFMWAVWSRRRKARLFGDAQFVFSEPPFRLGGRLQGLVKFSEHVHFASDALVTLACVAGRDDERTRFEDCHEIYSPPAGQTLSIDLPLPTEAAPTAHAGKRVVWTLNVRVDDRDGRIYEPEFEVPVLAAVEED